MSTDSTIFFSKYYSVYKFLKIILLLADMPTVKHFWNLQYLHMFRVAALISQFPFSKHLYLSGALSFILLLKNPFLFWNYFKTIIVLMFYSYFTSFASYCSKVYTRWRCSTNITWKPLKYFSNSRTIWIILKIKFFFLITIFVFFLIFYHWLSFRLLCIFENGNIDIEFV